MQAVILAIDALFFALVMVAAILTTRRSVGKDDMISAIIVGVLFALNLVALFS